MRNSRSPNRKALTGYTAKDSLRPSARVGIHDVERPYSGWHQLSAKKHIKNTTGLDVRTFYWDYYLTSSVD